MPNYYFYKVALNIQTCNFNPFEIDIITLTHYYLLQFLGVKRKKKSMTGLDLVCHREECLA